MDAGFALWDSITHRGGWDLLWGERETSEFSCFCSTDLCHSSSRGFNQHPALSPPEEKAWTRHLHLGMYAISSQPFPEPV